MQRCALLVGVLIVLALPSFGRADVGPQLVLQPRVTVLHQHAWISVTGVTAAGLDVRLVGATSERGELLPWTHLRKLQGAWRGRLPAPALRGVYVIELRSGSLRVQSKQRLRVFEPGTLNRPTFATPEQVVRWWVRSVRRGDVVALKRWPRPDFDRRDRRLHQLLVVAYNPHGDAAVEHRLGMFITAVRDRFDGDWRLLEATVDP